MKHSELSEASQLAYRDSGWLHSFLLTALADTFLPRKDQNYALPEFSKSKLWESQQKSGDFSSQWQRYPEGPTILPCSWIIAVFLEKESSRLQAGTPRFTCPQIAVVQTRSLAWDPALHGSHNPPTLRQKHVKPYKVPLISDAGSFHQGIDLLPHWIPLEQG